jgi:tRNA pseudouridine(38-40) synthase
VHPSFNAARHVKVNPPALSRAARTDRGVHAVSNVLGVSLPALGGNSARWLDEVNAALPPDVRVLRRLRTTAEFHAQRHCERRRYEYLLPYDVVCPGGSASEEEVVHTRQRLKALLKAFRGTKDFSLFTRQSGAYQAAHGMCRHIFKIFVPRACRLDGKVFLVLSICGSSFLYHMIRKVVGALVGMMRGALTEAWLGTLTLTRTLTLTPTLTLTLALALALTLALTLTLALALILALTLTLTLTLTRYGAAAATQGSRRPTQAKGCSGAGGRAGGGGAGGRGGGRGGGRRGGG